MLDKYVNKIAWTARAMRRNACIETIFDNGDPHRPEYIRRVRGPVYIEPLYGYAVTESGVLIEESMRPHFRMPTQTWRNGLPSPNWFDRTINNPGLVDCHKTVVSLRHFWEWNYYHFHLDVLGKLSVLKSQGLPPTCPWRLDDMFANFHLQPQLSGWGICVRKIGLFRTLITGA